MDSSNSEDRWMLQSEALNELCDLYNKNDYTEANTGIAVLFPTIIEFIENNIRTIESEIEKLSFGNLDHAESATIDDALQKLGRLIECHGKLLTQEKRTTRFEITKTNNILKLTNRILFVVFSFFDKSSDKLKNIPEMAVQKFTILMDKVQLLQNALFNFLDNVEASALLENHVMELMEVAKDACDVARVTCRLNVKVMTPQWKGLTKLLRTHAAALKDTFDISTPVLFLCSEIASYLESVVRTKESDSDIVGLRAKIHYFQLKVVIKLCECFDDYLDKCDELLRFTIILYSYSYERLIENSICPDVANILGTNLIAGADPLLEILCKQRSFPSDCLRVFANSGRNARYSEIGSLITTLEVLKKLTSKSEEEIERWLKPEHHIVDLVFTVLANLRNEGASAYTKVSYSSPESLNSVKSITIYEAILIQFCSFTQKHVARQQLGYLEQAMKRSLLENDFVGVCFAQDVWCWVAKNGDAELRESYHDYMSHLLDNLPENTCPAKKLIVESTAFRFYRMLNPEQRQKVIDKDAALRNATNTRVSLLDQFPDPEKKKAVSNELVEEAIGIMEMFLSDPESRDSYDKLISVFSNLRDIPPDLLAESSRDKFRVGFVKLWSFAGSREFASKLDEKNLVAVLCDVTFPWIPFITSRDDVIPISNVAKVMSRKGNEWNDGTLEPKIVALYYKINRMGP